MNISINIRSLFAVATLAVACFAVGCANRPVFMSTGSNPLVPGLAAHVDQPPPAIVHETCRISADETAIVQDISSEGEDANHLENPFLTLEHRLAEGSRGIQRL